MQRGVMSECRCLNGLIPKGCPDLQSNGRGVWVRSITILSLLFYLDDEIFSIHWQAHSIKNPTITTPRRYHERVLCPTPYLGPRLCSRTVIANANAASAQPSEKTICVLHLLARNTKGRLLFRPMRPMVWARDWSC